MTSYTLYCEVLEKEEDLMGYQVLVFKNLNKAPFGHEYCMVTVFPNWESRVPEIGEVGYLTYEEVFAGIDTYYDKLLDNMVKYNFNNFIFKRFIVKKEDNLQKDIDIII